MCVAYEGIITCRLLHFQMITLLRNPYLWDKDNIGNVLSPTTTKMQFSLNGTEIPVKDLPPKEELMIETMTPEGKLVSFLF